MKTKTYKFTVRTQEYFGKVYVGFKWKNKLVWIDSDERETFGCPVRERLIEEARWLKSGAFEEVRIAFNEFLFTNFMDHAVFDVK
jgi:hypothetical protein